MRIARKGPLCNLRTTQALISLRICWSGPSLSAYKINGYSSICRIIENGQIRLHGYACCSRPSLFAYDIIALFPRCTSYVITFLSRQTELLMARSTTKQFLSVREWRIFIWTNRLWWGPSFLSLNPIQSAVSKWYTPCRKRNLYAV